MTIAIELDVAISAVANGAEKPPRSIMAGIRTIPRAATVAGPEPEIAPKKQATITHTMAIFAFFVADTCINETDQPFGDTPPLPDISGQDKERNGKQQEFTDAGIHVGGNPIVSDVPEYKIAQIEDKPRQDADRNTKDQENKE